MAGAYYNVNLWEYLSGKIQNDNKAVLIYIGTEYDLFKEIQVSTVRQALEYIIKHSSSVEKCCIWGVVKYIQQVLGPSAHSEEDNSPKRYVTDFVRVLGIISSSSPNDTDIDLGGVINRAELIQLTKVTPKRITLGECISKWYRIVDKAG